MIPIKLSCIICQIIVCLEGTFLSLFDSEKSYIKVQEINRQIRFSVRFNYETDTREFIQDVMVIDTLIDLS